MANTLYEASFLRQGMLLRFAPETNIFGSDLHHFGVVLNGDPLNQTIGIVIGATSQIEKQVQFATIRDLDPNTVVVIEGGKHKNFGQKTAFKCNDPKEIPLTQIIEWYTAGFITIPDYPIIEESLLNEIQTGVWLSDMVSESTKQMLLPPKLSTT
jgi:hypothetical protein